MKLTRIWGNDEWTGGMLEASGLAAPLFTMERGPDLRIPEGIYRCFWRDPVQYKGSKYPDAIEVVVPGRTAILFHTGYRPKDSKGCIMLGYGLDTHSAELLHSKAAMKELMRFVNGTENLELWVV